MKFLISIPITFSLCSPAPGATTDGPDTSSDDVTSTSSTGTTTDTSSTTDIETTDAIPTTGAACSVGAFGCPCTAGGACDKGLTCDDSGLCGEGFSPPCDPSVNMDDCCGDGVLDDFEECDMAAGNDDGAECTSRCRHAFCGDGVVLDGVEACDGGKDCRDDCTLKSCGNGVVDHPDEDCDSLVPDDPECTRLCKDGRKIIFVSSEHYKGGEIGGLAGGDEKCQALADAEGLMGEFKVWLATSMDDAPLVRFSWADVPYVDVNGEVIAETWQKLYNTAGTSPPLITEQGFAASPSELTWTYQDPVVTHLMAWSSGLSMPGGSIVDPATCGGWLDVAEVGAAALLDPNPQIAGTDGTFKVAGGGACHLSAPVICVEQ